MYFSAIFILPLRNGDVCINSDMILTLAVQYNAPPFQARPILALEDVNISFFLSF